MTRKEPCEFVSGTWEKTFIGKTQKVVTSLGCCASLIIT